MGTIFFSPEVLTVPAETEVVMGAVVVVIERGFLLCLLTADKPFLMLS